MFYILFFRISKLPKSLQRLYRILTFLFATYCFFWRVSPAAKGAEWVVGYCCLLCWEFLSYGHTLPPPETLTPRKLSTQGGLTGEWSVTGCGTSFLYKKKWIGLIMPLARYWFSESGTRNTIVQTSANESRQFWCLMNVNYTK